MGGIGEVEHGIYLCPHMPKCKSRGGSSRSGLTPRREECLAVLREIGRGAGSLNLTPVGQRNWRRRVTIRALGNAGARHGIRRAPLAISY
jgi:hypothetical protein